MVIVHAAQFVNPLPELQYLQSNPSKYSPVRHPDDANRQVYPSAQRI